jgi:hypothetical protein
MYRVKVEKVRDADDNTTITLPESGASIYTKAFVMEDAIYHDMAIKDAGTTVDVKLELEQSHVLPAVEGAADANWSEPSGMSDIAASHTAKSYTQYGLSPRVNKYGRYKITDNGTTDSATAELFYFKQGQF